MDYFLAAKTTSGSILCTSAINNECRSSLIGPINPTESLIKVITYQGSKIVVLAYGNQRNCQMTLETLGTLYRQALNECKIQKDCSFVNAMNAFSNYALHGGRLKKWTNLGVGLLILTNERFYNVTQNGTIERSTEYIFPDYEIADSFFCFAKGNETISQDNSLRAFENALIMSGTAFAFPYFYCSLPSGKAYMVDKPKGKPKEVKI
jgi:hypothetical protein